MTKVASFTFNPFQENSYIVYDETKECIIVDPGCLAPHEEQALASFIEKNDLKPVRLINTHCHLDHVYGNKFVGEKYGLALEIHRDEEEVLNKCVWAAKTYGLPVPALYAPSSYLEEGDIVEFGNTKLEVLFTPGHSPASLSFYCKEAKFVLAGDVLFYDSVGRPDIGLSPGDPQIEINLRTIVNSIKTQLMPLDDDVVVYSGHMQSTTIGRERKHNPYLK